MLLKKFWKWWILREREIIQLIFVKENFIIPDNQLVYEGEILNKKTEENNNIKIYNDNIYKE